MTVDESGDVSMLSGEVNKWFRLHSEVPVDTLMDPALLVANTHILFNPKRGDIKVSLQCWLTACCSCFAVKQTAVGNKHVTMRAGWC